MANIDENIDVNDFQSLLTGGLSLDTSDEDEEDADITADYDNEEDESDSKPADVPIVTEKVAKQVETVKEETADDDDSEDTVYSDFASELASKGIIGESKGIKNVNDLFTAIENTVKEKTDKYVSSLHPYVGKLHAYIQAGGLAEDFLKSEYREYGDYEPEDEFTQEWLIKELKIKQGADAEEINDVITAYKANGTLKAKAEAAQSKLIALTNKEVEATIKAQAEKKAEADAQAKERLSSVNSHIDTIPTLLGKPLSTAEKTKLKDFMFTVRASGKTDWQTSIESGTDVERKTKLVTAAYIAMNGYGLSVLDKKNKTEQVSAFEKRLAEKNGKSSKSTNKGDYELAF